MILKIAIGAYGALSLIAALAQAKYKNVSMGSALLMGLGGIIMIASLFISSIISVYILTVGIVLAHISALINGYKMYGRINHSHHIGRFVISVFLVASSAMPYILK